MQKFERELQARTRLAMIELRRLIGGERLYAFALYTSHEDEYLYVLASANTEESFERRVQKSTRGDPSVDHAVLRRDLRWSAADWGYHDFSPEVAALEVPEKGVAGGHDEIYRAFVGALATLDKERLFGAGAERDQVTLNVLCGDMGERFFERGLRRLNPPSVVEAYFEHWTALSFIERVNALPPAERRCRWLALYEGLALRSETTGDSLLTEARGVGLTEYDVRDQLAVLGAAVVPALIALLQRYSRSPTFNEPGTSAHERDGAFTCEAQLASAAAFLIGEIGDVSEREISALQAVVAEVEERDREVPVASILAENVARVLHELRPRRFPNTVMDSRSNHLRNAGQFTRTAPAP